VRLFCGERNRSRTWRVDLMRRPDTNAPTVSGFAFANWPRPKPERGLLFGQAETSTHPAGFYSYPLARWRHGWLLPRAAAIASGVVGLSTAISSRVPMRATLNGVFLQAPRQIRSARRNYANEAFREPPDAQGRLRLPFCGAGQDSVAPVRTTGTAGRHNRRSPWSRSRSTGSQSGRGPFRLASRGPSRSIPPR
jgi:hypothetical protein